MSKSSEAVKRWRNNSKDRIVKCMGGMCVSCGYSRCHSALELHHLDPTAKEFTFGSIRANPKSWSSLVEELRKCVLLCSNCHREVHAGMLTIHPDVARFDEQYAVYGKIRANIERDACPICASEKPTTNRTCSARCAASLSRSIDWSTIDVLQMVSEHGLIGSAAIIGCSHAAVWKRWKKIGTALPVE